MARPLRLEFAGALYHVMSRGDRQDDIYATDAGRIAFWSCWMKCARPTTGFVMGIV